MANPYLNQFTWTYHKFPVEVDCKFVVDTTNPNGVNSLTGGGVSNVFMKAAAPAAGNTQVNGTLQVTFAENWILSYLNYYAIAETVTGAAVAGGAFVVGTPYVIQTLGNTTQAQWVAAGMPATVAAAPGVAFVAGTVGAGTGTVKAVASSGVYQMEAIGNVSLMVAGAAPLASGLIAKGGVVQLVMRDAAGALVQPANGCVISLGFRLSNSSVLINGS